MPFNEINIPEDKRTVAVYAQAKGFLTGFCTYHADDIGSGRRMELILLGGNVVQMQYVRRADMGINDENNIPDVARRVAGYAQTQHDSAGQPFLTGFTTFHADDIGTGRRLEVILIPRSAGVMQYVRKADLGINDESNFPDVARRVAGYAQTQHDSAGQPFLTGFTTFHADDIGTGRRLELILIPRSVATMVYELRFGLDIIGRFTFDAAITRGQMLVLLERHIFAISTIASCAPIAAQSQALLQAYTRAINHGVNNTPGVNASVPFGGASQIDVNFAVLFPQGTVEIAQTLIHEMMHCANFSHPDRVTPPNGMSCPAPTPGLFDCPFDGGLYYGSPPLQAELCIAGSQSDVSRVFEKAGQESCIVTDQGEYVLYRSEPSAAIDGRGK